MTIDTRLREAAAEVRSAVHPDALPPLTPPGHRARRPRLMVLVGALAVTALIAVTVISHLSTDKLRVATQPNPGTTRSSAAAGCPQSFVLPFSPRYLPVGWRPVGRHVAHANPGTDAIEVWSGTDRSSAVFGIIEVWRGDSVPTPQPPTVTIEVLGRPARFGPISDGSSVVFTVGDPATACGRWALVAHPGTTPEILRRVAENLAPEKP